MSSISLERGTQTTPINNEDILVGALEVARAAVEKIVGEKEEDGGDEPKENDEPKEKKKCDMI